MPIKVALAGAHDIVSLGLRTILARDGDIEIVARFPAFGVVPDVIVYDAVALEADAGVELYSMIKDFAGTPVLVVARDLRPDLAARALLHGATATISIEADAAQVLAMIRAAADGTLQPSPTPRGRSSLGVAQGLSPREVDVLGGVARGLSNDDIAHIHSLSVNSIKSYIRSSYRKIGVTTRSQAVAWCLMHGFEPPVR